MVVILIAIFYLSSAIVSSPPGTSRTAAPLKRAPPPGASSKLAVQAPSTPTHVYTEDQSVEMVIASLKRENITWLHDYLPTWPKNVYVVDDPSAPLTVPQNKGREAMVFLT